MVWYVFDDINEIWANLSNPVPYHYLRRNLSLYKSNGWSKIPVPITYRFWLASYGSVLGSTSGDAIHLTLACIGFELCIVV